MDHAQSRRKLSHPEVESLRLTFESLDTQGTGKVSFEHFLLNSGMKGEVFKGFMRYQTVCSQSMRIERDDLERALRT